MTKLKLLALGVLIATSAGVAHAEGKFSLGAGVGVVEHPYKDYDTDVYPSIHRNPTFLRFHFL